MPRNSELYATHNFPPAGPLNPLQIEYGDMIEYAGNGVTVMIYARGFYTLSDGEVGMIVDGNISCYMTDVVRVVKKRALQSL